MELKNEGLAREFVNRVQNMRKEAGFNVSDRIVIYYDCDESNKDLIESLKVFAGHIKSETLAVDLQFEKAAGAAKQEACEIDDYKVVIGIKKAQ